MLKARSRKLSLVLVLAMLMTMFAGLGTASAATGYSATHVPLVAADDKAHNLGAVIVSFDNLPAGSPNGFIIKLPADFQLKADTFGSGYQDNLGLTGVSADVYGVKLQSVTKPVAGVLVYALYTAGENKANILVINGTSGTIDELKFTLNLNNVIVPADAPEVINAGLIAQPNSVFADGVVQVAKTASGAVTALAGDPITVTAGGGEGAIIYFRENKSEALKMGAKSLTLKLPKGFEWDNYTFRLLGDTTGASDVYFDIDDPDTRTLNIERDLTSDAKIWVLEADIIVDESVASFGDIEVTISGASSVSPGSVVIGKYADYGVEVVVDKPETEVLAGRNEQILSDFSFKENIGDSLLDNRTIYVELPAGVEWEDISPNATGGVKFKNSPATITNKDNILKILIDGDTTSKGTLEINRPEVRIAGNFTGDIKAKIWGNAGINKEVVLAKVVAPISATADVKDVKIGLQKQAAGNIVITEVKAEAIDSGTYDNLTVSLPFNVTWGNVPTVKVIEGDIELGTVSTNAQGLNIPIQTSSSKASKIEISDITYTVDRTVPEGEMKATFGGDAVVQTDFTNRNYIVKVVVANCVTPAPGETIGSGEFRIGSNIYYAGGVAKVMDVAPYIKAGRTYVPMRYLGEILGAEVVWDAAARTVDRKSVV